MQEEKDTKRKKQKIKREKNERNSGKANRRESIGTEDRKAKDIRIVRNKKGEVT